MAKLIPYNIKVRVYCADDEEARRVQQAAQDVTSGVTAVGSEVLHFYDYYKRNEGLIRPIISDVIKNGVMAISRHLLALRKLK